jgi:hypothetical protein
MSLLTLNDRAHPAYFWAGSAAVTLGVLLHLPMFVEAEKMNFHLAGMPVDWRMLVGMAMIGGGTASSWYGLLPSTPSRQAPRPHAADLPRSWHGGFYPPDPSKCYVTAKSDGYAQNLD